MLDCHQNDVCLGSVADCATVQASLDSRYERAVKSNRKMISASTVRSAVTGASSVSAAFTELLAAKAWTGVARRLRGVTSCRA
jgi:hypothetical protein